MKKYVLLSILVSLGPTLPVAYGQVPLCENLFDKAGTDLNGDIRFLKNYQDAALILQKENIDPKTVPEVQSLDFFNSIKIKFIRKRYLALQTLLTENRLGMSDLLRARLFIAEDATEKLNQPHSYILIIGEKVYSFPIGSKSYSILNMDHINFTEATPKKVLRLNRKYILRIDDTNQASLYEAMAKDPAALLTLVKNKKVPPEFAKIYMGFKPEFNSILLQTDLVIQDLTQTQFEPIKIQTTSGIEQGYFFKTQNGLFYLTDKPDVINKNTHLRWGQLIAKPHAGFEARNPVKVIFEDGETLNVENDVLEIPKALVANNSTLSMMNIISTPKPSHYREDFMNKYEKPLKEFISRGAFGQNNYLQVMYGLEVALPALNPTHLLYVLRARDGFIYFEVDGSSYGSLAEISKEKYGSIFYTSSRQVITLKKLSGFLERGFYQDIEDISDVPSQMPEGQMRNDALFAKIQVGLRKQSLSTQQKTVLVQAIMQIRSSGVDITNHSAPQASQELLALTNLIKETMTKDNVFTPKDADEFIKMIL